MIFDKIPPFLASLLFVCRCDYRRSPAAHMGRGKEGNEFDFVTAGKTPRFDVLIWRPVSGWLLARIKLKHNFSDQLMPRLCFKAERGRETGKVLQLVSVGWGEYQAITFIGSLVRSVSLELGEQEGEFTLEHFALYNVPRLFTRRLVIKALAGSHPDYRGKHFSEIRDDLNRQIDDDNEGFDNKLEQNLRALIDPEIVVDYETWIRGTENAFNLYKKRHLQKQPAKWSFQPLISVLVPVFDPSEIFLKVCLDSVLAQTYCNWELCIVEDASTSQVVREVLEEYKRKDRRIRVAYSPVNRGVSVSSNAALNIARGEYVALLDHDDMLAPNALSCVVDALQETPRPRILFSDEDKIDIEGRRYSPHFKGDWNPDLLYSQNYVSHLGVYESGLLRSIGGFRKGFEGSQDFDLLLRASARVDELEIHHIPLILYHWRSSKQSVAGKAATKLYAWDAGVRALRSYFESQGNDVRVERGFAPFTYRCRWPLPEPPPLVSIIIPTRDNHQLLKACISSVLEKTRYSNFEIIVVNNDSRDAATVDYLAEIVTDKRIVVLNYAGAFNFAAINNFAAGRARGPIICLLNDDAEIIEPGWLEEMASHAWRQEIGCVGAKLLYPDGRIQHAGIICGIHGVAGHSHKYFMKNEPGYFWRPLLIQNLSAVTGACLVVRRQVWNSVAGMNSKDLPVAFNDVDFCLRVRMAGYRNLWTPYAVAYHHESASRGLDDSARDKERFSREVNYMIETWGNYLSRDPYYSPNLTRNREDFSLRSVSDLIASDLETSPSVE